MKYLAAFLSLALLTACNAPQQGAVGSSEQVEANVYTSEKLGLSFWYPSTDITGASITVKEEGNSVALIASDNANPVATVEVKAIDVPTDSKDTAEHLWKVLLNSSNSCSIEAVDQSTEVETYKFKTTASPYDGDYDANCALYSTVYYFPAQANFVALVSTGAQAPTLATDDDQKFRDSIRLK
jgi:hypothetical protein